MGVVIVHTSLYDKDSDRAQAMDLCGSTVSLHPDVSRLCDVWVCASDQRTLAE